MTTLVSLLSLTALVLLLLTATPSSCNKLAPGSHLHSSSRGEVKDEGASAPGDVIDNVVDVKAEDFVEKDTRDDLTEAPESALKDDVLQTLKIPGLNADKLDGLPPLQSDEQGTKVTSSRAARRRRNVNPLNAFHRTFSWTHNSQSGQTLEHHYSKYEDYPAAVRDFNNLGRDQSWRGTYDISFHRNPLDNAFIQIHRVGTNINGVYHYLL